MKQNNILKIGIDCCGCRTCEQICPQKCIVFKKNEEGFIYPIVDENKCIQCGACLKRCPINVKDLLKKPIKAYSFVASSTETLSKSASGGVANCLSRYFIEELKGVVFGSAYTEDFYVKQIQVDNLNDLNRLNSSKYVFSDPVDTFSKVKELINSGRYVLYVGTPCQIAGLKTYLGKDYENLLTISLICHGTPSILAFKSMLKAYERKYHGKMIYFNFRSKKIGWGLTLEATIKKENGKIIEICKPLLSDIYGNDFIKLKNLRESCYRCKFASSDRASDLTIGDFWGIDAIDKINSYKSGVSSLISSTEKGEKYVKILSSKYGLVKEVDINSIIEYQENLRAPSRRHKERNKYYKNRNLEKIYYHTFLFDFKRKIKKLIPQKLKKIIKKLLSSNYA